MKKRIILVAALAMAAVFAFASEELDVYTFLYRSSATAAERYAILRNVADAKTPGAGALYAEALARLLQEIPNLKSTAEKESADSSALLLATLLGQEKYAAAANDLWRVVDSFDNPLVKAEALIALGKARSPELFPQVKKVLADLNLKPTADPDAGEKIAYGAVIALEKYRSIEGYRAVFIASTAWYSRRVKEQASATLPFIMDDPSEPLTAIIQSEGYDLKLLALEKEDQSKAPSEAKSGVALVALGEGWRAATNDIQDRSILTRLRKLSLEMLVRHASSAPTTVPYLERSYKEGADLEEKLAAITALSLNKSDESARALSSFLMMLNARRRSNAITQEDERVVRALIPALGTQGNTLLKPSLQAVEYMEWTNAVKQLAADALKKIR